MTSVAQNKALEKFPSWATLLIVFVVGSYASLFLGGIFTIQAAVRMNKDLVDPQNIAMIASAVANLPAQLPAGFSYRAGLSLNEETLKKWYGLPASNERIKSLCKMSVNFLVIDHNPDKQEIVIASAPQLKDSTAKENLEDAYERGISTGTNAAHFTSVVRRGAVQVAGHPMIYLTGEAEDALQKKRQAMIGCLTIKDERRDITIYGLQPQAQSYDLDETKQLLDCMHDL